MYNYINRPIRKKAIKKKLSFFNFYFALFVFWTLTCEVFLLIYLLNQCGACVLNKACIGWLIEIICYSEIKRYSN